MNTIPLNRAAPGGVIFDIDGVLTFRGQVYPGAIEMIDRLRAAGLKLCFLTNSTLKSRTSAAEKLRQKGFRVKDDEVITASYASATYLRSLQPRSAWVMVEGDGADEFGEFIHDEERPEYIVIGDNRSQFDFEHLNRALRLLRRGAKLIGMTSELIDTSMGDLELNVGSWVRMLEAASGVPAVYVGKPHRFAFALALQTLGLGSEQVLMVGDRVQTDVLGAHQMGLQAVLVKTGEFDPGDLDGEIQPDLILERIADLPRALGI